MHFDQRWAAAPAEIPQIFAERSPSSARIAAFSTFPGSPDRDLLSSSSI